MAHEAPVNQSRDGHRLGRLNDYLGFRLRRVHQQLSRGFSERATQYGLRTGAFSALAIIEANPGISQTEMARIIDVDASIAVALIDSLKKRGYIRRKRDTEDKRRYSIELTEQGVEMLDSVFAIVQEIEDQALHSLTPTELLTLNRLLDQLYAGVVYPGRDGRTRAESAEANQITPADRKAAISSSE